MGFNWLMPLYTKIYQFSPSANVRFSSSNNAKPVSIQYKPKAYDKYYLIWSGKYKNMSEIPEHISVDTLYRARNKVRIRVANILMALTLVGCVIMSYRGKKMAERGESVSKMNLDWHKQVDDDYMKKKESEK